MSQSHNLSKTDTLIIFNKPFGVLTRFTQGDSNQTTLKEYISKTGVYPCGRLDADSEGLLILAENGKIQSMIAEPKEKMFKTYLAQVEGEVRKEHIEHLEKGVLLKDGLTRPAQAKIIPEPEWLWQRNPPIRVRKLIPTSWISLSICEGKNRQVRRMTAAVGLPTLRLIRTKVGPFALGKLMPGESKSIEVQVIHNKLTIVHEEQ